MFYLIQILCLMFFIVKVNASPVSVPDAVLPSLDPSSVTPQVLWNSLTKGHQAQILLDLDYLPQSELPLDTKTINYLDSTVTALSAKDLKINNLKHKSYIEKIISVFESEVSREDIEQSEYSAYGESEITALYLLVDDSDNILGSVLTFYQDGRDQDGEEADINWQARVRFDSQGDIFLNDDDEPYDELYFEWSGH